MGTVANRSFTYGISGEPYTTIEYDFDTSGALIGEIFYTANGSVFGDITYTYYSYGKTAMFTGFPGTPYYAYEYDYSADGSLWGTKYFYIASGAPYASYEIDDDAAGRTRTETFWRADGSLFQSIVFAYYATGTTETFSGTTGGAYSSYELDFSTDGSLFGSKYFYTGITGQPYTIHEVDYDSSNRVTHEVFLKADNSIYEDIEHAYSATGSSVTYTGVPGSTPDLIGNIFKVEKDYDTAGNLVGSKYLSYSTLAPNPPPGTPTHEQDYDANGRLVAETYFNGDGSINRQGAVSYSPEGSIETFFNFTGEPYSSYEIDSSTDNAVWGTKYFYTGITNEPYQTYEEDYDAFNRLRETIYSNNDGSHTAFISGYSQNIFTFEGMNTFVFSPDPTTVGNDVIYGFQTTHDVIQINSAIYPNFGSLLAAASADPQSSALQTHIALDAHDSITIAGVAPSSLTASNFIFFKAMS